MYENKTSNKKDNNRRWETIFTKENTQTRKNRQRDPIDVNANNKKPKKKQKQKTSNYMCNSSNTPPQL